MTPATLMSAIRAKYNAIGDTFWSDTEIFQLIYQAHLQLARETLVIERTYSTTVTSGQAEYAFPDNTIAIKRIEYDGVPLLPVSMDESYRQNLSVAASTLTGTPSCYYLFNETIKLTVTPDNSTSTLKIYSYNEPQEVSNTSTLEVPSLFHMDTTLFCLAEMLAKDKDFAGSRYYLDRWEGVVADCKRYAKRQKRGSGFATVQVEEFV